MSSPTQQINATISQQLSTIKKHVSDHVRGAMRKVLIAELAQSQEEESLVVAPESEHVPSSQEAASPLISNSSNMNTSPVEEVPVEEVHLIQQPIQQPIAQELPPQHFVLATWVKVMFVICIILLILLCIWCFITRRKGSFTKITA